MIGPEIDEQFTGDRTSGVVVPIHQPIHQTDVTALFTDATRQVLRQAAQVAIDSASEDVDTSHLLRAVLDDPVGHELFDRLGGDREWVCSQVDLAGSSEGTGAAMPRLTPDAKRVLIGAFEESLLAGAGYVGPEHLLVALAIDTDSAAGVLLRHIDVSVNAMRQRLPSSPEGDGRGQAVAGSPTPTIDSFSKDLTRAAREGRLDPVVGRAVEIDQAIEALSRRLKNNPLLIGDPGVGKTAVVEAIAQRIVSRDVPAHLEGRRLVALELQQMVAGARLRGEFEERLTAAIDEAMANRERVLLFIDEFHTVIGAGAGEGAVAAAEILKPRLGRGELQLIGATTVDGYRRHVERDVALARRFQPVSVPEPPVYETIEILSGLRDRYETFHRVQIVDEAIVAAAEMSARYIPDRALPDKAVDLLDQAAARVRLRPPDNGVAELRDELDQLERNFKQTQRWNHPDDDQFETRIQQVREKLDERHATPRRSPMVVAEDVAQVVARATGIPVARISLSDSERLLQLEEQIGARIIGQSAAVSRVCEAVRRNRTGLSDPERPTASFLFLGPTGVGKTELAKALATTLVGDADALVRFDMTEFQERHTVARLIGAPPGYVGYEEAGQLTEQLRRRPYSVLLFDEIEKAHPDVSNVLLQLLDDGRISDTHGRLINGRHCIVILTSNIGLQHSTPSGPTGFAAPDDQSAFDHTERVILEALSREFRPEFLNRIDDTIVFRPLGLEELRAITALLLQDLRGRLAGQGIRLEVTDGAIDVIARDGFDPEFGARPLRRTIDRTLSNELSRMLLDGRLVGGQTAVVDDSEGELAVRAAADGDDAQGSDLLIDLPAEQVEAGTAPAWEERGLGNPPVPPGQ